MGTPAVYWEYGPEDAEITVLAIHGFRGDHHGMEPILAYLHHLRVISPDLPGFGETPSIPGRTHDLDLYSAWLTEFAASLAPGAVILGHSFGSIVVSAAVSSGLSAPQMILVNPIGAPALEGPRGILTKMAVFYYGAGARLPRRMGEWLLRWRLIVRVMSLSMTKTRDKALRRFVHDQHREYFSGFADRDVLRDAFVASVSHDVSEFASAISTPTLLIAAERDDITPISAQRTLVAQFPDATLVEIPDVGHLIHYETPDVAASHIIRYLQREQK